MNSRLNTSNTIFLLAFALTFYCLGASFVEGFVNYRTWGLIGPDEFKAYHQALSPLIIRTMVVPIAIKSVLYPPSLVSALGRAEVGGFRCGCI